MARGDSGHRVEKGKMPIVHQILLEDISVTLNDDDEASAYLKLEVDEGSDETTELRVSSPSTRNIKDWYRLIKEHSENNQKNRVFGVSLQHLQERGHTNEKGIPVIFLRLAERLETEGLKYEGIFRVSADPFPCY